MKIALWIAQGLLAILFIAAGAMKLFFFDPRMMSALADLRGLVVFIGVSEIAGAIGLIVPLLTGIMPVLTAWAAMGLATIMVLATGFHLIHGEFSKAPVTVVIFLLTAFVAYGRGFSLKAEPVDKAKS